MRLRLGALAGRLEPSRRGGMRLVVSHWSPLAFRLIGLVSVAPFVSHSVRRALVGSRVAALRAGSRVATRAARLNTKIVINKIWGAKGFTPNSCLVMAYPA